MTGADDGETDGAPDQAPQGGRGPRRRVISVRFDAGVRDHVCSILDGESLTAEGVWRNR